MQSMLENLKLIRQSTNKKILAVVKCNAYGLGIEEISSFLSDKVDGFVVADISEAVRVQSNKPVLILLPDILEKDLTHIKSNFILTIDNVSTLQKLKGNPYTVHIFVDTGMHRFGIKPENAEIIIKKIKNEYPNITIDGIYTHLNHPRNARYTRKQISVFRETVEKYRSEIPHIHILNSGGFLHYNDTDFDNCLRIGNLLYGYCGDNYGFKKIFSYKTRLVSMNWVDKDQYIGYGNRYKTKKATCIGVLGVGFIHGFNCSKDVKSGMLYNLARTVYHSFKQDSLIFYNQKPVKIMGGSSMNFTQICLDELKVDKHSVFDIKMSSILADGLISKKYLY
jgi:alanine racemase